MIDQRLYSVTTAISILDKPGLLYWAAEKAARAAVTQDHYWNEMIKQEGEEVAIRWLANARFRETSNESSATALGTAVHEACEITVLDGKAPKQISANVGPFIDQFVEWLGREQPEVEHTERPIYNLHHGYAGTCDLIAKVRGKRAIIDYKTSKKSLDNRGKPTKPYFEAALQLSAYRQGEVFLPKGVSRKEETTGGRVYLYGDQELDHQQPLPIIDTTYVLHITPNHCNLHPVVSGPTVFAIFRHCLGVVATKAEIGNPIGKALVQ